jgi:hypothetical protein
MWGNSEGCTSLKLTTEELRRPAQTVALKSGKNWVIDGIVVQNANMKGQET